MDYFGQLADDLVDMAEEIERLHPVDGVRVIRGLERVMKLAIDAENVRYDRGRRAAAAAREAEAQMPGSQPPPQHAAAVVAAPIAHARCAA